MRMRPAGERELGREILSDPWYRVRIQYGLKEAMEDGRALLPQNLD